MGVIRVKDLENRCIGYGRKCDLCEESFYVDIHEARTICPKCQAAWRKIRDSEEQVTSIEKVMEDIQTQVIEFPDTHQKFVFARKIETDGDSIKICGWEYKGVKDGERGEK